jgi:predicted nucleic acid-binding protein
MISAIAINAGASLATSNRSDFERFAPLGLKIEKA